MDEQAEREALSRRFKGARARAVYAGLVSLEQAREWIRERERGNPRKRRGGQPQPGDHAKIELNRELERERSVPCNR
jgi:hypothetical protein